MRQKSESTSVSLRGILLRGTLPVLLGMILTMTGMSGNLCKNERIVTDVHAAANPSNPRIVSDSSMTAGQKVTWDCVWFGSYPQTEIVDNKETCGTYGKDWGKTSDYVKDDKLYSKLQSATGWNSQGDLTLDGKKYRRIRKSDATYSYSGSGYYNWHDSSSYHYFRYDKIKWRVLKVSGGHALLLADQALDDQKYNKENTSITWAKSTIRSWLNGYNASTNNYGMDFTDKNYMDSAFSSAEQGAIVRMALKNDETTGYYSGSYGGDGTVDYVFLLSSYDLYNTDTSGSYGFYKGDYSNHDEARRCKSSTYAKAMGTWSDFNSAYSGNCDWWLRSPGHDSYDAASVYYNGYVDYLGSNVNSSNNGVRPALYLNLSSSNLWSSAGTVCSDGTVDEEGGGSTGEVTIDLDDSVNTTVGKDTQISAEITSSDFEPNSSNMSWTVESSNGDNVWIGSISVVGPTNNKYILSTNFRFSVAGEYKVTLRTNQGASKTITVYVQKITSSYSGKFNYTSSEDQAASYNINYKDAYFDGHLGFSIELARTSLAFSMAAYNKLSGNFTSQSWNSIPFERKSNTKAGNIFDLMVLCGFDQDSIYVNEEYLKKPTMNSIGVAFAKKTLSDGSTLIPVIVRGGGYESEWAGNFNVYGSQTHHEGFRIASETVYSELKDYIRNSHITGKVNFWLTGYSRAGATANLVAAYIDDDISSLCRQYNIEFNKRNVYAYTFEAPRNTKDQNTQYDKYGNIYNIINPVDLVPLVAFEKWGYRRYGIDYYVPSSATFSNYSAMKKKMKIAYKDITGEQHVQQAPAHEWMIHSDMNMLASNFWGLGNDDTERTRVLTNNIQKHFIKQYSGESTSHKDNVSDAFSMTMDEMNLPFGLGGAIESYVKGIKHAHYCELALAWMLTLDKVVEDNKEPCYRLVRVNCPVDVQVYDFSNQLVAEIKNDETSEIENSEIDAFVDNDGQKIVLLPMDEDYSVKLKATGNATMTYSVSDFSVAKSSEEHKRVYYDIPISTGDTFTDGISCIEGGEEPVTEDVLKDSRGKVINPGEEMSGSQVKTYTVTVEKTGNGTVEGGGIKTKGEFASVEAAPDSGSRFAGWYVNNKLVSSDLKYRFCVKNDITLTARFASLENPRIVEDSSMTAGQKVTWDCVWFGAYPQTEIVDKKETCGTYGKDWGKSTDYVADTKLYSKLQNATGWDSKGDLTLDGQKYRRIKKSDATYSSSGSDHYNWNDSSGYHYFRYDKIKWRVLNVEDGRALLLADQALDDQKYNTVDASVTWVGSTIRSWLNGYDASKNDLGTDFTDRNYIDNAFSSAEKGAIVSTDIDNRTTGSYSNNYGGDNTTDKVFLLSSYDLYSTDTSASYGFYKGDSSKYDEARRCKSSTYAKAMGTYTNTSSSYSGNCRWWLRSPGDHSYNAANVNFHGYVYIRGFNVSHDHNGARPALYLDLSSSKLCSPAGTVCSDGTADEIMDPYTLDQEAAGAVIEMINALNDNSDENAVKKARAAYDKLTQAQKDRIDQTILNKLEEIEALYNTNLANSTVTLSKTSYTYTGKKLTPGVTVKLGGKTLTKGTDYTVAYKNNLNAGTAKVTVTGKGKYTGSATANFTIKPVKLSDTSVIDLYVEDTLYYTGKAQAPYYIVKNDNIWYYLVPGTDFTLSGNKKATSIGTYKLVFTGKGNYTGTVTRKYSVKKKRTSTIYCGKASYSKRLGDAQFDLEAYGYDGWDTYQYYDLTYKSSNTKVATVNTWGIVTLKGIGKATITIKLPGDYEYNGATKKVTITVKKPTVKATSISKLTNVKGKKMTVKWKKRAGITGYQIQYTLNKKFKKGVKKITVKKAKTTKKTIAKLKLKKKYFVRIRTYRTIYGKKYYSKWSGAKAVTVKK